MQTFFTKAQLQDPDLAEANTILRACVHCGLCTATCPSYLVLGDERDSPRGRIYLIKDMLETGRPAGAGDALHIDRCLSCLGCTSTCPSGVDYMHLIDQARAHVDETYRRPLIDRLLRAALARILPYPARFRLALIAARLARPFARLIPDARLRAMIALAPARLPAVSRNDAPQTFAAKGPRRARVALLTGCAQKVLDTDINDAAIRLLTRAGVEVVVPRGLGCCGSLSLHMGRQAEARAFAQTAIRAIVAEQAAGLDAVIITTSGCGTSVKDYGHLFVRHPLEPQAREVAGLARDITEFIAQIGLPEGPAPAGARGLRVAYHAACSLQHGQKITGAPLALLRQAGFAVSQPQDSHLCCGSAGTYNLLQPQIADELRRRKVEALEASAPQVIAAGNIGCMRQIGAGSAAPVVHTVQLLDWASGGPMPPALKTCQTFAASAG